MRLEREEIEALADSLAHRVADILERRLCKLPELAMSIPEAAAYAKVEESTIRNAIRDGRLLTNHKERVMPDYISPDEVDRRLSLPAGRAVKLARRGVLPHVALPDGTVRFEWGAVESSLQRVPLDNPGTPTRGATA